jgi:hypothetical protein
MAARDEIAPADTPPALCGGMLGAALLPLAAWLLLRRR